MIRVAINGFGRIGRLTFKKLLELSLQDVEIVAINDLTDPETLAHLLKYDSTYGVWDKEVSWGPDYLQVEGKRIKILQEPDPSRLPWKDLGVHLVLESTGRFREYEKAQAHLEAGARYVVISAPSKTPEKVPTFILGVNEADFDPERWQIIDMGSCTTNCFAVLLRPIVENFEIESGVANTIHSYTNNQRLLDLPHKDLRRARAAALNIVPTSTGAAKTIFKVYPELQGKMDAIAFRVPTPTVSVLNLLVNLKEEPSLEDLKEIFLSYQEKMPGIFKVEERPLVSSDYKGSPYSCVLDWPLTRRAGRSYSFVGWYDNEAGYAKRLAEFTIFVAGKISSLV